MCIVETLLCPLYVKTVLPSPAPCGRFHSMLKTKYSSRAGLHSSAVMVLYHE